MRCLLRVLFTLLFAISPAAQESTYNEFHSSFSSAREAGDLDALDLAIRLAPTRAMYYFAALCKDEWFASADNRTQLEEVREIQELMKGAWRRIHGDDTVLLKYRTFFEEQTEEGVAELSEAEGMLRRAHLSLGSATRSRRQVDFDFARDRFTEAARTYEELGDQLHAAEAWQGAVFVCSQMPEQTREDRADMVNALERFIACRESWSWTSDAVYERNLLFFREQRPRVAGELLRAGEGLPVLPEAEELVVDLKFAMLEEMEPDMFVEGGPVPLLWPEVELFGETYEQLPTFKTANLFLRRVDNRYWISAGQATSENATRVQASNNPNPSEFDLDDEGTTYAIWFYLGNDDERFMSAELNLEPTKEWASVFYRSASSWVTTIHGETVTFYDDNCDGRLFTPDPFLPDTHLRTLGEVNLAGTLVPAYDSMRIGQGPRVPYSRMARIGDSWYALRGVEGKKVGIRPLDPERFETGKVRLDWQHTANSSPDLMVIHGKDSIAGIAFDISSGRPVDVPVGQYELGFGRITTGSGGQGQMALIFKGESKPFVVEKGETFELAMGARFSLEYEREGTETDLVIDSTKIRVLGSSGAIYTSLHNAVPTPNVLTSRNPDGSNARRIDRFVSATDGETTQKLGQRVPLLGRDAAAFPLPADQFASGDPVMRIRVPSGMLVGLRQDVHPLFGKLWPVWK